MRKMVDERRLAVGSQYGDFECMEELGDRRWAMRCTTCGREETWRSPKKARCKSCVLRGTNRGSFRYKPAEPVTRLVVLDPYPEGVDRPRTRGDCARVERPCPWVSCRHNLYLDVTGYGTLRIGFPGKEPWEMDPRGSCSLDVADRGEHSFGEIAEITGVSRERTRQLESKALRALLRRSSSARRVREMHGDGREVFRGTAVDVEDDE